MSTTTDPREAYVQTIDAAGTKLAATHAELNTGMDGITATAAEINAVADISAGAGYRVFTANIAATDTTETNILTLPVGAVVLDVIVNIVNAAAEGVTINIGTQGTSDDPDGFCVALPVNVTGTFSMANEGGNTHTIGGNETYRTGTNVTGALLTKAYLVGANLAEDTGIFVSKPWFVATADPVSYTLSGSITSFAGTITIVYLDVSTFSVA